MKCIEFSINKSGEAGAGMELEVPQCSDSELAILWDKWRRCAASRDPLAMAMARDFSRERERREALRRQSRPRSHQSAHAAMR